VEQDIWERKYHLALERMERDEGDFRDIEAGLRRLAMRLASLASGQGTEVDALLDRLHDALKGSPTPVQLEDMVADLSDVVARMDSVPADTTVPVADDAPGEASSGADTPATVEALRADVGRLQDLLAAVSTRLGDMTRYLAAELERTDASTNDGRSLDATVRDEMRLLGEKTLAATDLRDLQDEVNARLSFIDRHFREYREREDARAATFRDHAERMRERVAELETQAASLQDSLRREHALTLTDPLTGLPNRLAYERHIAGIEHGMRNEGRIACVAAFDIDHFKLINDTYGHAAGDAVLRIVSKCLARELEGSAFVARYGGEEFVVVFGGMAPDAARLIAEGLCATVASLAFHASSKPVKVTMSGGLACFGATEKAATVFDRADRALYAAKRAGRNRCIVLM